MIGCSAWRCCPAYEVASDGEDYQQWLAGAAEPTWSRKQPWLDTLRRERENGQVSTRVRILSEQVSDYERYACGFGYRYNGEYEDIRVLHRGEHEIPAGLIERDFWIIGRADRQREMIADQRRHWTLIQTEGALRWQARSPTVMAEQVEHLIELGNAQNVELGVIDWRTTVEVFPHTAFHLYDQNAAIVATRDGTAIINDKARLTDYRSLFDELGGLASFGHAARDVLQRIAHDYLSLLHE